MAKKQGRGKLSEKQKLTCLIPIRLTPPEHKKFAKIAKEQNAKYISQLAREAVLLYMEDYALSKSADEAIEDHARKKVLNES